LARIGGWWENRIERMDRARIGRTSTAEQDASTATPLDCHGDAVLTSGHFSGRSRALLHLGSDRRNPYRLTRPRIGERRELSASPRFIPRLDVGRVIVTIIVLSTPTLAFLRAGVE
jgi:hypothetical protein